ncbi:MAG: AAA family ATPase [Bacteroidales bacterium]|nr:AAA family ATPase [Bacteroidales bacterium]
MKLKTLNIKGYKNIQEQYFNFSANQGIIALVGENGSGKSNLLEVISYIFNSAFNGIPTDFEYLIDYTIDADNIVLTNSAGSLSGTVNGVSKTIDDLKAQFLPSRIIANYSGEDLRLFNKCYKTSYDKFTKQLKAQDELPTLPMVYINKYYWDLCLLSLYFTDHSVRTDIADFCSTQLGIKSVQSITFEIDFEIAKNWKDNEPRQLLQAIFAVDDLYKMSELDNDNDNGIIIVKERRKKVSAKITLSLEELKERSNTLYGEDDKFFLFLFAAFTSKENKLLKNIDFKLELSNGTIVGLEALSEGEKKLILIEFITKILGNKNALVLLDEPDAHTHISRKKELFNAIKSFEGQTILTTHSPVFVDILKRDNIVFMKEGQQQDIAIAQAINDISGGALGVMEGAIVSASPYLIVTEGPGDILHINKAIEVWARKNPKYKILEHIPLVFEGGAENAEEFCNSVIASNISFYKSVVFVFDYDTAGRDGSKAINNLRIESVHTLFYHEKYPVDNTSNDFYIEDFYPHSVYRDIQLPHVEEEPRYYQMKRFDKVPDSVKKKITKQLRNNKIEDSEFDLYENFLDELLKLFKIS